MMVITLSHWIGNVIEVNIWKEQIMKYVVLKFGCLKIDIGGDIVMCSEAIYHQTTYNTLARLLSLYILIGTHHFISTNINFEITKFYHNVADDLIHLKIAFNQISYLLYQSYDHHPVMYPIYIKC